MLFWIFVSLLIVGIAFTVIYAKTNNCELHWTEIVGILLTIFGGLCVLVSLLIIVYSQANIKADVAAFNQRYESLVYQYENDIYENDNDLGKRELMVDIQEWNEDLARNRELQDNFWIGIYVPDIYDQFEFIEMDRGMQDTRGES